MKANINKKVYFFCIICSIFMISCLKSDDSKIDDMYSEWTDSDQPAECGKYIIEGEIVDFGECPNNDYCENNICKTPCENMDCGTDHGINCGSCKTGWHCNDENLCYDPCEDYECGENEGVSCGVCTGMTYCNEAQQCEEVCVDMDCGTDQGIDCGSCFDDQFCDANVCRDACEDMECGTDRGIDCGSCLSDEFCDANQCRKACEDMNCGTDHDVDCGTCSTDMICGSDNVCYDPCEEKECGNIEGVDCGTCDDNMLCSEDNMCYNPCEGKECGMSDGVDCGSCGSGHTCEDNQCIFSPCQTEDFPHYHAGKCWSDIMEGKQKWEADSYCGLMGGRLPTINELRTLIQNCPETEYPQSEQPDSWCPISEPDTLESEDWIEACNGCEGSPTGTYSVFADAIDLMSVNGGWFVSFYSAAVSEGNEDDVHSFRCLQ